MATTHQPPPPPSAVSITAQVVGRRTVLTVEGEVDIGSTATVAAAIERVIADGAAELWIDLALTTFMDSAGVHLLLETRQRLAGLNRELAVVAPSAAVRRLFAVAGVAELLAIYPDRQAAHLAR